MLDTMNGMSGNVRGKSIELLGENLMQLLDLERHAKLAHWNVKGPQFIALHGMFDNVATEVRDLADTVAERLVALGGVADARSSTVASRSRLPKFSLCDLNGQSHVSTIARALAFVGDVARDAVDQSTGWGDAATADVFTQMTRSLDKLLWLVEAHREAPLVEP